GLSDGGGGDLRDLEPGGGCVVPAAGSTGAAGGGQVSRAGPPQEAKAPSGGSEVHAVTSVGATSTREHSLWWRVVADFLQSRTAVAGLVVLLLVVLAALAAPWITPQNPYDL